MTGVCLASLGACLQAQEKLDEAVEVFEEAIADARVRDDVEGIIAMTGNLSNALGKKGRFAEAEKHFSEVLPVIEEHLPEGHQMRGFAWGIYGRILSGLERYEEAAAYQRRCFANLAVSMGEDKYQTVRAALRVYPPYQRLERFEEAEVHCRKAIELLARRVSRGAPGTYESKILVESTRDLVDILAKQAKYDEATATLDTLDELAAKHLDADDPTVFEHRGDRGAVLVSQGRHAEAEKVLESAWSGLEAAGKADAPEGRRVASTLARLYAAWDRPEDAATWRARAGEE